MDTISERQSIEYKRGRRRYGELDVLRTVAIVMMVLFHLVYDLHAFGGLDINEESPFWSFIGDASATLFILLSGLSGGFSSAPVKRGFIVLLLGMGITVATYIFMREEYIRFGILHFLGVTMILSPILFKMPSRVLWGLVGLSSLLGFWFKGMLLKTSLLIPFGILYSGFNSMDYYPLFPYLAINVLGILIYRYVYAAGKEWAIFVKLDFALTRWMSKHSLGIYLAHQPIILLVLFTVRRVW